MSTQQSLDCVIIGYNETPFAEYESTLKMYGEDSEAYRDLKFSFIDIAENKYTYVDLLNYATRLARNSNGQAKPFEEFKSGDIPNLAAVYLSNYLLKQGLSARYINLFQYEKDRLIEYLSMNPACVAITTTFYILNLPVIEMVRFIRQYNDKTKIIIGGPLISNHYRRYSREQFFIALEDIGADIYVIESQGEQTLSQIVRCVKDNGSLSTVPNIVYYHRDSPQMTPQIAENNSIDDNFIDWGMFADQNLGVTLQTRTARSCAFSCAFCAYPLRAGKLTLSSLDTIERELDAMHKFGNIRNVVFIDDTFNVPLKRFKEICRLMIKKEYNFNWFSYFRCSNSDEEAIELMARSGCKGVFLGIESGSPTILENMHKAAAVEQYRKGIKLLRDYGVVTFGSFITGFPGETKNTINETIDFIKDTKLDFYRTQLWYCEPGTPIYDKRDKYAIIGDGFRWQHETMESMEAMDYIERVFLSINTSLWLPQWSFDFWFIPYALGRGISIDQFKAFMTAANQLLALEIAYVSENQKHHMQQERIQQMLQAARQWAV